MAWLAALLLCAAFAFGAPAPSVDDILAEARAAQATGPLAALALLESGAAALPSPPPADAARVYDALGDLLSQLHRPQEALLAHLRAKATRGAAATLAQSLLSHSALATDYRMLHRFNESVTELVAAQTEARRAGVRDNSVIAPLILMESVTLECAGDAVSALQRFEMAKRLVPSSEGSSAADRRRHIDLLQKVMAGNPRPPPSILTRMQAQIDADTAALITAGPWRNRHQLPEVFVPGLTSAPWHHPENYPGFVRARDVIEARWQVLADEFAEILSAGLLEPDYECIHAPSTGAWRKFSINTPWRTKDANGCSVHSPVACALLGELALIPGISLIRAEYSMVEPGTWIQPHFGHTNAQLKFHLGVIVPSVDAGPCAHFRVGPPPWRAWVAGKALLFDDSYSHEVWNNCTQQRVVFQVVVLHPDVVAQRAGQRIEL